jgi:hypothetical protein
MAFTRFNNDKCRTEKHLQQSTDIGRYHLNVPGNGLNPTFFEDPHIRLSKWGGNNRTNHININSDLKGLTRKLNNDNVQANDYKGHAVISEPTITNSNFMSTEQSRSTHPSWLSRDLEQNNFDYLYIDPQKHSVMDFNNNVNTRIIYTDNYNKTNKNIIIKKNN